MAIYHCSVSVISRKGRSVCAAAAYCAAEKIKDERTGITHDFTHKGGVLYSEIIAPAGSPVWATNRAELWNHAEQREEKSTRHAIATTAREFRLALPHELNSGERITLTRAFGQYLVNNYGVAVDFSIHAPDKEGDDRNFHVHMLISDRSLTDAGFAGKLRVLSPQNGGRKHLVAIRKQWAESVNSILERSGFHEFIDHRSFKSQLIDREPTIHLGVAATALERRGDVTERGNFNRKVAEINAIREERETLGAKLHAQELENIELGNEADEVVAIEEADTATIIEYIPTTHSTFTAQDVDEAARRISDPAQRKRTDALSDQHWLDQLKATVARNPSATKITNKDYMKIAKAKAKADYELSRMLERDHPSLGRGR